MPASFRNPGYRDRRILNAEAKTRIAALCARQIPGHASVLLNIGTSTEAVARALVGHKALTVITNNVNVAEILSENDSATIIMTGGVLRREDGGLVGDLTTDTIRQFKVDYAVIGISALDHEGDLLEFDLQEVRVSRAIIECSARTFLVVDSSKFERSAPVRIASLKDIDAIFTDRLPDGLRDLCARWDTAVFEADAEAAEPDLAERQSAKG